MKRILLFVAIMLVGLFSESRLNQSSNQKVVKATVTNVEKIKNKKKGDKPFIYKVNVSYENDFGRSVESSFIARVRPHFQRNEKIIVSYNISNPSLISYPSKKYRP